MKRPAFMVDAPLDKLFVDNYVLLSDCCGIYREFYEPDDGGNCKSVALGTFAGHCGTRHY